MAIQTVPKSWQLSTNAGGSPILSSTIVVCESMGQQCGVSRLRMGRWHLIHISPDYTRSVECYRCTTSYPSFISRSTTLNLAHTQSISAALFAIQNTRVEAQKKFALPEPWLNHSLAERVSTNGSGEAVGDLRLHGSISERINTIAKNTPGSESVG